MTDRSKPKQRTAFSLVLYVIVFNLFSWMGWLLARNGGQEGQWLGMIVWLTAPLAVSLGFRLFGRDWKDMGLGLKLRGNGKWYLFSILFFPLVIILVLGIGKLFGAVSLTNFSWGLFFQTMLPGLAFTFVKNIFEEFSWRGFLTPKVDALVKNSITGHLLVGLVWGTWHIPYYTGLLDQAALADYSPLGPAVFVPLVIGSMVVAAIVFGELRLLTGSTWPAVLMHTVSNVIITTLLVSKLVQVPARWALFFTPSWEGLLSMLIVLAAGMYVYRQRMEKG